MLTLTSSIYRLDICSGEPLRINDVSSVFRSLIHVLAWFLLLVPVPPPALATPVQAVCKKSFTKGVREVPGQEAVSVDRTHLRNEGERTGEDVPVFNNRDFQSITHFLGSHASIVTRPVSATFRLLSLVHDLSLGSVRWVLRSRKLPESLPDCSGTGSMDLREWERRLDDLTGSESGMGTLDLLVDGEEYFTRLEKRVKEASESIKIRTYIFDNDDTAIELADILREKSMEVDVRILLDGQGTIMATGTDADSLPEGYKPPVSVRSYLTAGSSVRVRQQFNLWLTGDHAKTTIIDSRWAFLGGMNIGREYRHEWHDVMVELQGPVVDELEREFDKIWSHAGVLGDLEKILFHLRKKKRSTHEIGYPLRVLYTRPGDREIYYSQLEAIKRSKNYIFIETPYFTDDAMLHSLALARKRGVDVRVILPRDPNWAIMRSNNALTVKYLMERGVKVYLYQGMTHVKAAVYDGWACLGSANHDNLSFRTNYEINIATSHLPVVKKLLKDIFERDFLRSVELLEPLPIRITDYLLEVVADQL